MISSMLISPSQIQNAAEMLQDKFIKIKITQAMRHGYNTGVRLDIHYSSEELSGYKPFSMFKKFLGVKS